MRIKKLVSLVLAVALVMMLYPAGALILPVRAEGVSSGTAGDCTWTLDADGVLTISGEGKIYQGSWNKGTVTEVIIENGVTDIGKNAFKDCTNLMRVTIPDSVTRIEAYAFYSCESLTSLTVPASVRCLGSYFVSGCSNLESLTVLGNYPEWNNGVFVGISKNTNLTISDRFFERFSSYMDYAYPQDCRTESGYEGGTYIRFSGNLYHSLYDVSTDLSGDFQFAPGVKRIAAEAFEGCTGLTGVAIPDGVTYIGSSAFAGCTELTNVTIPSSVTGVGNSAFSDCGNLQYTLYKGGKYLGNEKEPYLVLCDTESEAITAFEFAPGVKLIAGGAFENCTGLTSLTIPDSVTAIGDRAFSGCSSLTDIAIPDSLAQSVYEVGRVFAGCTGLTSVTIPDGVKSISCRAFENCTGLKNVVIPDSVKQMGLFGAPTSPSISDWIPVFENCTSLESVTVPINLVNDFLQGYSYPTTKNIKNLTLTAGSGKATKVISFSPAQFPKLTTVVLPDTVTKIGDSAFSGCTSLASVTISDGVTSIGESAFRGCNCLTDLVLPDSVTSIGDFAFSGCSGLTDFKIPGGVTDIGSSAFSGCSKLNRVTILSAVTSVGENAFNGCDNLSVDLTVKGGTTFDISESMLAFAQSLGSKLNEVNLQKVAAVPEYAFENCTGLTTVYFSKELTEIGEGAFIDSEQLTDIYFAGSEAEWNEVVIGADNEAIEAATVHFNTSVSAIDCGGKALYEQKPNGTVRVTLRLNSGYLPVPGSLSYTTASGKTERILNKSLTSAAFGSGTGLEYEFTMPNEEIDHLNATYRSTADTSFATDTVGTSLHYTASGDCDGIRFLTRLHFGNFKSTSNTLRVDYNSTRYTMMEFGTLIKRAENDAELTVANAEASTATGAKRLWKSVAYTKGDDMKLVDYTDAYVDFSAVMMRGSGVNETAFNARSYTARGYMKLRASSGAEVVIECDNEVTNSINTAMALL